eukprot:5324214-Pyramimonas_sp.AAC.2
MAAPSPPPHHPAVPLTHLPRTRSIASPCHPHTRAFVSELHHESSRLSHQSFTFYVYNLRHNVPHVDVEPSPGVDGQKGLRLQLNSPQSLVDHSAHGISNSP